MDNMTAKVSCFARAYHYRNNKVHVFSDSMAEKLLGEDYDRIADSMAEGISFFLPGFAETTEEGLRRIVDLSLSPSVLGRSEYCERVLENEIKEGCRQYIVFAAGYDTFAMRNNNTGISVFELDLPEMLGNKRKRIQSGNLKSCAIDVPCNLAEPAWTDEIIKKGYRIKEKAFGSMLGISYYLEKDDWDGVIGLASSIMTAGSAICFDYPSENDCKETKVNRALAKGAGEDMKARYSPQEMTSVLEKHGFCVKEHLDHKEMTEEIFAEYNSQNAEHLLSAPEGVCYVTAVKT